MGCTAAPWTGAIVPSRALAAATAEGGNPDDIDMDAPPDVLSLHPDGKDRGRKTMAAALAGKKRVFVCGLALDFCVLDTCINARQCGFESVHMLLDVARAAHIDGVGAHGSGFLSDPQQVLAKLRDGGVHLSSFTNLLPKRPAHIDGCGQGRAAAGVPRVPRSVWARARAEAEDSATSRASYRRAEGRLS